MPSLLTIYNFFLSIAAAGIALSTLFGFLGRLRWYFELFSHFRVQYAALGSLCAVGFLLAGQYIGFFFSLGVSLLNLALILPLYRRPRRTALPDHTYRLLTANILGSNGNYDQIARMLAEEKPDLALLVEYDQHHHHGLSEAVSHFPYTVLLPRKDNYGIALLSQIPFITSEVALNGDRTPVLVAKLELEGRSLTVIGCHPKPPKKQAMTVIRDRQILELAQLSIEQPGEVFLLGDMNTTSWSYTFRDLLRASHLLDSRRGFGIQPTWPAHLPLMSIPIDHILHTPGIHITHRFTRPLYGSDHRPVVTEFCLLKDYSLASKPVKLS
jgi:endonuclease/exonuclease/phosphatase (EEP) superfamily protein YafD